MPDTATLVKIHTTKLVDLSADLPLVIEFFDLPNKITSTLETLKTMIEPDHLVCCRLRLRVNWFGEEILGSH